MTKRLIVLGSVLALTSFAFAFPDQAQGILRACFGSDFCGADQSAEICCDPAAGQSPAKK